MEERIVEIEVVKLGYGIVKLNWIFFSIWNEERDVDMNKL